PDENVKYFGDDGDRMQMMFNFHVNQRLFYALASADTAPLAKALNETRPGYPTAQWGVFLRNHDELDLGRLEDDQRQAVFDAFGPDKSMQLYDRGIRRRLAPMLKADRRRLELAYSLMFTLPGAPVLRYGDEIAMGDDLKLPERDCARTPMQWSGEANGGFSKAKKTFLPAISGGGFGFETVNVAQQRRDPNSILNWMERVIRMRQELPEIGWGDFRVIPTRDKAILALRYDWRNNAVVVLHNFDGEPRETAFDPGDKDDEPSVLINLLADDHSNPEADGRHHIVLEGYGYRWYRLGGLDYLLNRTEI
ncbi:MAG TPA: trehalose synthase, partial [Hansschlegelia sp.]